MSAERKRRLPKPGKPKLLFDEGLPPRQSLPHLNRSFDVKHIEHDLRRGGSSDLEVYSIANRTGRVLVTFNVRHFRSLVTPFTVSVIGLSTHMTRGQLDLKLTRVMKELSKKDLSGRFIPVTGETGRKR